VNVSLTPQLEQYIRDKVRSGLYQTGSEVVREALRLLQAHEEAKLANLRAMIDEGERQIAEGRFTTHEPSDIDTMFDAAGW